MTDANSDRNLVPADPAKDIIEQLKPALRPEKRNEAIRVVQTAMAKLHIGPLPAPEDFAHYEDTCEGSSGRILTMAEKAQTHRHQMEANHLQYEYKLQSRGQNLALLALLLMLGVIAFAFWVGQPVAASVLGSATIIGVVGMFLGRDKPPAETRPAQPQNAKKKKR